MRAFDESECDLLSKALELAYLKFVAAGRLNERNHDITKSILSRAVMHRFQLGERDEFKLAKYALTAFEDFVDEVSRRDFEYLKGTPSIADAVPLSENDQMLAIEHQAQ